MTKITTAADLPFEWAPDMPGCRIVDKQKTPAQMMARATELAVAAMNAITPSEGEVVAFRAARAEDAARIKATQIEAHNQRNAEAHAAALARKAERINVHAMRNADARAEAQIRKAERIAAHEARNQSLRKSA